MLSSPCSCCLRLIIILSYLIMFSSIEKYSFAQEKKCGKALAEALAYYCVNRFNGRIQRSLEDKNHDTKMPHSEKSWYQRLKNILKTLEHELDERNEDMLDISYLKIEVLIRKRKQVYIVTSKGVADECCIQGCTYADIIKYCA